LIYRPNPKSDEGMMEMPFSDLVNPLEGEFDLSRCGDAGQYLSINCGYKKGTNSHNSDKIEIWIVPKFVVEKELNATASHYKDIMAKWTEQAAIGIFWTWGGWDNLTWFDYLVDKSPEKLSSTNFYELWPPVHPGNIPNCFVSSRLSQRRHISWSNFKIYI
jgi:hypothetical protein